MRAATPLPWVYDDGGRADAGFKGDAGDCVVRAIAIATEIPYPEVYLGLRDANAEYASAHRDRVARVIQRRGPTSRNGNFRQVYEPWLRERGWVWHPTMQIGSGTTVHLDPHELPGGRLIVAVSKHLTAVIDRVHRDTHEQARDGTRAVYGWYQGYL